MRVLATFPELAEASAPVAAARCAPPDQRPLGDPPSATPRTIRRTAKPRFPTASIVALGLLAAALWGLAVWREPAAPDRPDPGTRLAIEPDATAQPGTTR